MTIICEKIQISGLKNDKLIDITPKVSEFVRSANIGNAVLNIYAPELKMSVIAGDYNKESLLKITSSIESAILLSKHYNSEEFEYDSNIFGLIKSLYLGRSVNIPVINNEIQLSAKGKIILIDFNDVSSFCDVIISLVN